MTLYFVSKGCSNVTLKSNKTGFIWCVLHKFAHAILMHQWSFFSESPIEKIFFEVILEPSGRVAVITDISSSSFAAGKIFWTVGLFLEMETGLL